MRASDYQLDLFSSRFSFTDDDNSQDNKGRKETILIPLYQFHLFTNIQTFYANLNVR